MDISAIRIVLQDRNPRTAQQLKSRIANRLAERLKTASSAYMSYREGGELLHGKESTCTVGQHYDRATSRNNRLYGNKGRSSACLGWQDGHTRNRFKRLSLLWMKGVKSCFICRLHHLARQYHAKEEVKAAIIKLRAKRPTAHFTFKDFSSTYSIMDMKEKERIDKPADRV